MVVVYDIPPTKGNLVQKKRFYEALKKDQDMNRRKYNYGKKGKGRARQTISPEKPMYDMDVEIRHISAYEQIIQEVFA